MKKSVVCALMFSVSLSANGQLGDNLLNNPGAESGFDYWLTPNSDWGLVAGRTGTYGWAVGPVVGTQYQSIDLLAKGYSAAALDNSPTIAAAVYVYPGWSNGTHRGIISIKVELLDASSTVLSTTFICSSETLQVAMSDWAEKATSISGYSSGMRTIRFTFVAQDALGWDGYYGPIFDDANVQLDGPLPVELATFYATERSKDVELLWTTATEADNAGWEIERSGSQSTVDSLPAEAAAQAGRQTEAEGWEKIGFVEGAGTSTSPKEYTFTDPTPFSILSSQFTHLSYRLRQIDRSGAVSYSEEIEVNLTSAPRIFFLSQNYPNPFNPTTEISFSIETDGFASLRVFDMLGREVATLFEGDVLGGRNIDLTLDARQLSSGVYMYRLTADGRSATKRMILMK